jgi:hypothetical protein
LVRHPPLSAELGPDPVDADPVAEVAKALVGERRTVRLNVGGGCGSGCGSHGHRAGGGGDGARHHGCHHRRGRGGTTPEFRYTFSDPEETQAAGVMDASTFLLEGAPSYWSVYLGTTDTDASVAKAVELGAALTDPTGAVFKLRG